MGRSRRSGNIGLTELEPSLVDGGTGINGEGVCPEQHPERKPRATASSRVAWGSIRRGRLDAEEVELEAAWLIYVKQRFN
jgi:hypothetical protein